MATILGTLKEHSTIRKKKTIQKRYKAGEIKKFSMHAVIVIQVSKNIMFRESRHTDWLIKRDKIVKCCS